MDIRIMPRDLLLTAADDSYIRNRLYFGLAANHRDIDTVEVSLCSAPASARGSLLRCQVDIRLTDGSAALGDSMESNLYVAIDRAVDRACSSITLNVDWHWRDFSRTDPIAARNNRPSLAA